MMNECQFQQAYLNYKADITRYLERLMGNREDAEDLTQECFIRLINVQSEVSMDKLGSYLRKTARNLAIDIFRKRGRSSKQIWRAELASNHYDTSEMEIQESIEEIVSPVKNGEHRKILELRLLHGYTTRETAELVNKSEGMIRSSLFHAVKRIRQTRVIS
ncbi:RNA polymerase sigma factor [Paenibacillus oryzae]|nr:RNA polymerase sigma factor [Paenibacillus oryzae]